MSCVLVQNWRCYKRGYLRNTIQGGFSGVCTCYVQRERMYCVCTLILQIPQMTSNEFESV